MKRLTEYKHTFRASYIAYMSHAVVNNFVTLLFVTFNTSYGISYTLLGMLATFNFCIQLCMDFFLARFGDRIGYRRAMIIAHGFMCTGLLMLAILPDLVPNAYVGLLISILFYAIGGGCCEVLVSPIVEACPTDEKAGNMSLLHSFYCWGHVLMILISVIFFAVFGIENWKILTVLWAVVPFVNAFYYSMVPINHLTEQGEGYTIRKLFSMKWFWLFFFLMLAAGTSEQAMSQWASAFAEAGLHVSKTVGDLAGPCFFAVMMGLSRTIYAKFSERIPLTAFILGSSILCIISYLLAGLSGNAVLALFGCGLCGFSVGIMWPGTLSLASAGIPKGGTAMFALLALAGDVGCSLGPGYVGIMTDVVGSLNTALLTSVIFPIAMILGILILFRFRKEQAQSADQH